MNMNKRDHGNHYSEDLVQKTDLTETELLARPICDGNAKKDSQPYLPKTIQHILAGLQRKMLDANTYAINFLHGFHPKCLP